MSHLCVIILVVPFFLKDLSLVLKLVHARMSMLILFSRKNSLFLLSLELQQCQLSFFAYFKSHNHHFHIRSLIISTNHPLKNNSPRLQRLVYMITPFTFLRLSIVLMKTRKRNLKINHLLTSSSGCLSTAIFSFPFIKISQKNISFFEFCLHLSLIVDQQLLIHCHKSRSFDE